jgi:dTMP kinase
MLVVFEGIDGSGKTTISNRAAEALRAMGLSVAHVRSGGRLASDVAEGIREFTRDQRHLALTPYSEFLLYVARESQQLDEAIRPALGEYDIVIADRFLYTAEVLARHGRGLPAARIDPVLEATAHGCTPDLVILVTVDPQVALARRRAEKVLHPSTRTSSRKGLAGAGLNQRLHEGYLELARRDPSRWLILQNTDAELDKVVESAVAAIRVARSGGADAARQVVSVARLRYSGSIDTLNAHDPESARERFLSWIDKQTAREPNLAAYMLGGLSGEGVDNRRVRLATRCPELTAYGLGGLDDEISWCLRHELTHAAPRWVARSLIGTDPERPDGWELREELMNVVPAEVSASLEGLADLGAWDLRERLWALAPDAVMASLARDDSARAWALRERWLELRGGEAALAHPELAKVICSSIRGLAEDHAWQLRHEARSAAPVPALLSLEGVTDERSWRWRERLVEYAPRPVMRSIVGVDHPRAWALREAAAERCKETLDSIVGMDQREAWALRERCMDLWPSTVAKSLGVLGNMAVGREIVSALLRQHPGNLSLLKHATALASMPLMHSAQATA